MTAAALQLADGREAAGLAAFLARLLHYDRAAAVRVQAGGEALAVFGRPPSFEVLAIRTARLRDIASELDVTVSAGRLADALDAARAAGAAGAGLTVAVPESVTGPPWVGMLPPRGGWRTVPGLPAPEALDAAVGSAVAEFRARDQGLPPERRTRAERDRIGREIWSRTLGATGLPLRALHAARSLGFLRPAPTQPTAPPAADAQSPRGAPTTVVAPLAPEPLVLLAAGNWLRLRTPYGSIAVRTGGLATLLVTPT